MATKTEKARDAKRVSWASEGRRAERQVTTWDKSSLSQHTLRATQEKLFCDLHLFSHEQFCCTVHFWYNHKEGGKEKSVSHKASSSPLLHPAGFAFATWAASLCLSNRAVPAEMNCMLGRPLVPVSVLPYVFAHSQWKYMSVGETEKL